MNPLVKRCPGCEEVKNINTDYYHNKSSRFVGVRALCKKCDNESCRQYKKQNKKKVKRYMRRWISKNQDKKLRHMRKYNELNPFRANHISVMTLRKLYYAHPFCEYCGVGLAIHEASIDHRTPLVRGGTNDIDNLGVVCCGCNYLKHTKTHEEFLLFLPVFTNRLIKKYQGNIEPTRLKKSEVCDGQGIDPINAPTFS